MNAVAAVRLFSTGKTAPEILHEFCVERFAQNERERLEEMVGLFDALIDQLWYFAPFAQQSIWFRRLRVPPLLWIFWDTILVNRALRLVFNTFQGTDKSLRKQDRKQRRLLRRLRTLVEEMPVREADLEMAVDTFGLLAHLRKFYLGKAGKKRERKIRAEVGEYRQRYPHGFTVECDFTPFSIRWMTTGLFFSIFMRTEPRYRRFDRFLLIPLTGWMFPLIKRRQRRRIPDIAERQAAGLEIFFR